MHCINSSQRRASAIARGPHNVGDGPPAAGKNRQSQDRYESGGPRASREKTTWGTSRDATHTKTGVASSRKSNAGAANGCPERTAVRAAHTAQDSQLWRSPELETPSSPSSLPWRLSAATGSWWQWSQPQWSASATVAAEPSQQACCMCKPSPNIATTPYAKAATTPKRRDTARVDMSRFGSSRQKPELNSL